jgi:hypothetical protein
MYVGKEWKCYMCDSTPLKPLKKECQRVLDHIEAVEKKAKEKKKQQQQPAVNGTPKSKDIKPEPSEVKSGNKASKPPENKQLRNILTTSNSSSRSSSPSEFQKAILTQPHAGTTINTEKIIIDPNSGKTTKFEMVYPNANVIRTQYKPYARPTQVVSSNVPTQGPSMSFTGLLPGNIHSIISNMLSMTDNLHQLLKNIQENVIAETDLDKLPFEISLRTLSQQQLNSRLTAVSCVKSGVNLFLQEMAMKTSAAGVKAMNLDQQKPQTALASALLTGSPMDKNVLSTKVDTPQKFDKPGGTNSPLVTSTPKPKSIVEEGPDVVVLSPSPMETDCEKPDESKVISTTKEDDVMDTENEKAKQDLLKDAAEEVGSENEDSDLGESQGKEKKKETKGKGKLVVKLKDAAEEVGSENEDSDLEESQGKEKKKETKGKGKLVVKLKVASKKGKSGKSEEGDSTKDDDVSSTTKEDDGEEISTRKTRKKGTDGTDTEEKGHTSVRKTRCRSQDTDETDTEEKARTPVRKTRCRSQDTNSDSDKGQTKGSKTSPVKKIEKGDLDAKKTKNEKGDKIKTDKGDLDAKKTKNDKGDLGSKSTRSSSKSKSDKIDEEKKSKDDDTSDKEDSKSDDSEKESDDSDDSEDDFEESKPRRSSRRLNRSGIGFNPWNEDILLCL